MYLDLKKIAQWFGTAIGILALGFGIVSFLFSATVTEQIAATLNAIFGLMFIWYMTWLRSNNPAPAPKSPIAPPDRSVSDPSRRRVN